MAVARAVRHGVRDPALQRAAVQQSRQLVVQRLVLGAPLRDAQLLALALELRAQMISSLVSSAVLLQQPEERDQVADPLEHVRRVGAVVAHLPGAERHVQLRDDLGREREQQPVAEGRPSLAQIHEVQQQGGGQERGDRVQVVGPRDPRRGNHDARQDRRPEAHAQPGQRGRRDRERAGEGPVRMARQKRADARQAHERHAEEQDRRGERPAQRPGERPDLGTRSRRGDHAHVGEHSHSVHRAGRHQHDPQDRQRGLARDPVLEESQAAREQTHTDEGPLHEHAPVAERHVSLGGDERLDRPRRHAGADAEVEAHQAEHERQRTDREQQERPHPGASEARRRRGARLRGRHEGLVHVPSSAQGGAH